MRNSILSQQSLSFIDYINLNKSKSYARNMQSETNKDNPGELCSSYHFSLKQRGITQVNRQPTNMLCCICALNFKKYSDKSIAQATVFPKFNCSFIFQRFGFAVTAEKKFNK